MNQHSNPNNYSNDKFNDNPSHNQTHHNHSHHQGHSHSHSHQHFEELRNGNSKGLTIALITTSVILLLEFFGGLYTNSLALLSDSGHMLSDVAALLLSLIAFKFASRPATPDKTFGFYRFEILAALLNGIALFVIAGLIVWEAVGRFAHPPTVGSGPMMLIAVIGLIANLVSAVSLMTKGDVKNNVNMRGAYLHVLGDALGSVGAIVAGILMYAFGWYIADPIISVVVALLILKSGWGVIQNSVHILMEGTPASVNQEEVKAELENIDGVVNVHDLHIWCITSGLDALSCHLLIGDERNYQDVLQQAINRLKDKFGIEHTTIQVECAKIKHQELKI
ncbi:cation diffusion facilitator family transporter [Paenibacillus physcomitrellae]|uniref:Cation transporter n=1 Tax=Paenibacillus physcomitrellae TaxID=1619311 RepID=A0ABQ1GCI3_9BACL|nr:cation diffusion facilitator family transporter [Paenibacillus physcomitrellae]GGA41092.1 cation transporter [Paenibacillus physcomitrellae]